MSEKTGRSNKMYEYMKPEEIPMKFRKDMTTGDPTGQLSEETGTTSGTSNVSSPDQTGKQGNMWSKLKDVCFGIAFLVIIILLIVMMVKLFKPQNGITNVLDQMNENTDDPVNPSVVTGDSNNRSTEMTVETKTPPPPEATETCNDLLKSGKADSDGVYMITLNGTKIRVFCDMNTRGGGWTVFQRRINDNVDFYRDWASYQGYFGDVYGSYWLGLDNIHYLTTKRDMAVYVKLIDFSGVSYWARNRIFSVGDESSNYTLTVDDFSGTAGDSLGYHNGRSFTTKDRDNDRYGGNCAVKYHGAWWFDYCGHSNLNGRYYTTKPNNGKGITWRIPGKGAYLKSSVMMMRETN